MVTKITTRSVSAGTIRTADQGKVEISDIRLVGKDGATHHRLELPTSRGIPSGANAGPKLAETRRFIELHKYGHRHRLVAN